MRGPVNGERESMGPKQGEVYSLIIELCEPQVPEVKQEVTGILSKPTDIDWTQKTTHLRRQSVGLR